MNELEEYFKEHPEEEEEFLEEIIRLHANDEPVDYPEDWNVYAYN